MNITAGHMKHFSLGQHRQSYLTLNLKCHELCMAESHDIPGYLREPWKKGAPEIPKEVRMRAPERFQWDHTWLDEVRREIAATW